MIHTITGCDYMCYDIVIVIRLEIRSDQSIHMDVLVYYPGTIGFVLI